MNKAELLALSLPEERLKEFQRLYNRALCRVRCLEAALERIDPDEFDTHMDRLETARAELFAAGEEFLTRKYDWYAK